MAYVVDRVVICDAYQEPAKHYQLLAGGRSKLAEGRRPSMRFLASAKDVKGGIAGVVGKEAGLFDDLSASAAEENDFVNQLRDEVRAWREAGYPGTAIVTRRLLEWWFERDEERRATAKRFFFCQQEAVETVIYLYEVQNRRRMPETGDLLRYALKLATGTGKTVVMALFVTWATLHKRKVSGSSLSANFLVLVPNLTVRDRVSGQPRGDGLDPAGEHNLYDAFEMVPPEYRDEFHPNVLVRNWQGIPLEAKREDWIGEGDVPLEEGRFIPQSVLRAMRRRAKQDPNAPIRRLLGGWRDLVVINDEAHHVYGEKRARKGEDPDYIKWSRILERVSKAARLSLVLDLSATPWYGSGSPKPEGTLYEWLVSDFSVYDAFESGLVKVVRLPDPDAQGRVYLDLWDLVKGARTREEYLRACKGAIASIYSSWKKDYDEWASSFEFARGPAPVLLCVTSDATRAGWVFEHLTREYELLRNPDDEDRTRWVTIQIDSKVFDADKGQEAVIREMVNTVGSKGKPGEHVRAIVSVNMLSEGWDVKSVTHILGLRAFGSPLLTEQIIGRGLRRTNYDVLNQPLEERPEGSEETVDAFGIPFVGFPVEKRKRPKTGDWGGKPVWIEPDPKKAKHRVTVPNVRSWAVGVTESLADLIRIDDLPQIRLDPRQTPPDVHVRPVVGGAPEAVMTLAEVRREWPVLRTAFLMAEELFQETNPGSAGSRHRSDLRRAARRVEVLSRLPRADDGGRRRPERRTRRGHLLLAAAGARCAGHCDSRRGRGRRRGGADPRQSGVARQREPAPLPVDRHRRRRQALPHQQGALSHRSREALRRFPRRREGRKPILQERAARLLGDLLREQPPAAVLPGLHRRRARRRRSRGDVAGGNQGRDPAEHRAQERGSPPLVREDEQHQVRAVALPLRAAEEARGRARSRSEVARRAGGEPGRGQTRTAVETDRARCRVRQARGIQDAAAALLPQGGGGLFRQWRGGRAGRLGGNRGHRPTRRPDVRMSRSRAVHGADDPRRRLRRVSRQAGRDAAGQDRTGAVPRPCGPRHGWLVHGQAVRVRDSAVQRRELAAHSGGPVTDESGLPADRAWCR